MSNFGRSPEPEWDEASRAQAEQDDRLAAGLVPCAGFACRCWLDPDEVYVQEGDQAFCRHCGFISETADCIEDVALMLLRRGLVIGRRFSIGPYTPAVRDPADPEWEVVFARHSAVIVRAHDVFEAVRWYCRMEGGGEFDPTTTIVHPSDAALARSAFTECWR